MKSRRSHLVPLASQTVELLKELYLLTGRGERMFPGFNDPTRAMSENTVRVAMRRMGFEKEQITPHGLRGTASTILHERGWPTNVVEAQLAHLDADRTRAAYNHAYAHVLPGYRRLQVEYHGVFYKVTERVVLVVRVLHDNMDAPARLQE